MKGKPRRFHAQKVISIPSLPIKGSLFKRDFGRAPLGPHVVCAGITQAVPSNSDDLFDTKYRVLRSLDDEKRKVV
jgi:hypothetical protein